jgi:TonB-dependent receptor
MWGPSSNGLVISRRLVMGASLLAISNLLAAQAAAQDAAPDDTEAQAPAEGQPIVVRGVRQQLSEAATIERQADNIVTVITADDIGQFPDQNIAEALQRAAGVTIIRDEGEGRFITVRGLDAAFTQVTISNAQIGSSDADGGRSVALDVIPSELLSSVEVGKTLLPNQDHDSLGAKIDLRPLSAFDRGEDFTARFAATAVHTEYAGDVTPKLTADFTKRFDVGGGEIGVAAAVNFFDRTVAVDRTESESGDGLLLQDGIFYPAEIEHRRESGSRERIGGTATIDYRSNDGSDLFSFSVLYGRLQDNDIRIQQEVELRDSAASERRNIVRGFGEFSDIDVDRQVFFQERTEETYALHFEGRNAFGDDKWVLSYAVDYSKNNFTLPNGLRATFRNDDDIIANASWGRDFGDWELIGLGDFDSPSSIELGNDVDPSLWLYDSALVIDERREDEIFSYNVDLAREFDIGGVGVTVQAGFKQRQRDRSFLRGEFDLGVEGELDGTGLPESIGDFTDTFVPESSLGFGGGVPGGAVFPGLGELRDVLNSTADIFGLEATDLRSDFTASEDTTAYYLMATLELTDNFQAIIGGRLERTEYTTTGLVARSAEVDGDPVPGANSTEVETFNNDYSEFMPAVHLRWDATQDIVFRASYSQAQVRPSFGDASALQTNSFEFNTEAEEPGCTTVAITLGGNNLNVCNDFDVVAEGGNPGLQPLTADQFDVNFGWYPDPSTSLTVAAFYKDLQNPFIEVSTDDPDIIELLGGAVIEPETGLAFTDFDRVINAGSGRLYGIEIGGNHFFTYLDGWLSNLFLSGNVTLIDSEVSSVAVRDGETVPLPDQSDIVANLSAGYESDKFLLRIAANYRGEQLQSLDGSDPELDVFRNSILTTDVVVRYAFTPNFQIFADVSNVFEAREIRFYRGNEASGNVFNRVEDFGRIFQLGVNLSF